MTGEPQLTTAGAILDAALLEERWTADRPDPGIAKGEEEERGDEVEELVTAVFSAALDVERVPRSAAFTALGGDSLMAISILSRVWRATGVKLPTRSVVPSGSVATVAAELRRARRAGLPAAPRVPRRTVTGKEEASENQAAIWFLESGGAAGPLYNVPYGLRLSGRLDVEALRVSLRRLVDRHEALRMRFKLEEGRLLQEPVTAAEAELPLTDLSGLPDPGLRALELGDAHVRTPIDLGNPPLIRPRLLRLGPRDHLLVLVVHHIVCDAWSIKLMLRELAEGYASPATPDRLPAVPGFLDFVAWQRSMLDGPEGERLLRYWSGALSDVDATPLPTDRPRSEARPYVGDADPIELDRQVVADLRRVAGDQGMTLYMLLLSAYSIAIGTCLGRQDVVVGSPVANREQESMEKVVGYLANMLPMRVRLEGDPTLRELFGRVRATALDAYDHQALPFARLVREIAPPRLDACNPLFQTALVLNEMTPRTFGGLGVSEAILHTGTSKLDLTCYLEERRGGGLEGHLEYASALLLPATARRVRLAFERALGEIATYVDQPLSEVQARLEGALATGEEGRGGDGRGT
ncbi:MAG TPA: condensation domain-containing protein [Solirubrobacterales bacterium]|nr:condensation domain-containing protein [Solirubrobacterales bacterium]